MKNYETVSEAVDDLTRKDYTRNFIYQRREERLVCNKSGLVLSKDDSEIDEVHRFEVTPYQADEMIVFAVSNKYIETKGSLVNAFRTYAGLPGCIIVQRG